MRNLYESYVNRVKAPPVLRSDDHMVNAFDLLQAVLSAVTLLVAAMVSYRAFKGYGVARNVNLLLLALGFAMLCLYFLFSTIGFLGSIYASYPPNHLFTRYFVIDLIQVVAYLLVMLAYVVKPRAEDAVLPLISVVFLAFSFELFIVILLLVVVISVWSGYRSSPTAGTALVLASFTLLFLLHAVTALLLFSPRLIAAGSVYYAVMQMLSFTLLFMAIGHRPAKENQRRSAESA